MGAKYIDGERVYNCSECSDTGRVTVFRVDDMHRHLQSVECGEKPKNLRTYAVGCFCSRGNATPVFDSRVMLKATGSVEDAMHLQAFVDLASNIVRSYWRKHAAATPTLEE